MAGLSVARALLAGSGLPLRRSRNTTGAASWPLSSTLRRPAVASPEARAARTASDPRAGPGLGPGDGSGGGLDAIRAGSRNSYPRDIDEPHGEAVIGSDVIGLNTRLGHDVEIDHIGGCGGHLLACNQTWTGSKTPARGVSSGGMWSTVEP